MQRPAPAWVAGLAVALSGCGVASRETVDWRHVALWVGEAADSTQHAIAKDLDVLPAGSVTGGQRGTARVGLEVGAELTRSLGWWARIGALHGGALTAKVAGATGPPLEYDWWSSTSGLLAGGYARLGRPNRFQAGIHAAAGPVQRFATYTIRNTADRARFIQGTRDGAAGLAAIIGVEVGIPVYRSAAGEALVLVLGAENSFVQSLAIAATGVGDLDGDGVNDAAIGDVMRLPGGGPIGVDSSGVMLRVALRAVFR